MSIKVSGVEIPREIRRVFDVWVLDSEPKDMNNLGNPAYTVGGLQNIKQDVT